MTFEIIYILLIHIPENQKHNPFVSQYTVQTLNLYLKYVSVAKSYTLIFLIYLYFHFTEVIQFKGASSCLVVSTPSLWSHSLPFLVIFALERHYLTLTITSFQGVCISMRLCLFQAVKQHIWVSSDELVLLQV